MPRGATCVNSRVRLLGAAYAPVRRADHGSAAPAHVHHAPCLQKSDSALRGSHCYPKLLGELLHGRQLLPDVDGTVSDPVAQRDS
ncbi:MAG: hypothetical protein LC799_22315, partial [Actinobacteria bacterium]|nr:hypothetical protein [Actinomycetota bacterium]